MNIFLLDFSSFCFLYVFLFLILLRSAETATESNDYEDRDKYDHTHDYYDSKVEGTELFAIDEEYSLGWFLEIISFGLSEFGGFTGNLGFLLLVKESTAGKVDSLEKDVFYAFYV